MAVTGRGLIGTGSASTAGTTITVTNTTGATIPAGTFIHITGAWDNIASVTAPTITSSTVGGVAPTANHATAIGSGVTTTAGSGVWHQCFRVLTTGTIASGATIATLTSNQSAVKRAAHAEGFNNCTATLRGTVTTGTSAAGTPTVTTTGTALVIGDLAIGSISLENNAQATADADTTGGAWPPIVGIATSGGGAAVNVDSGSQYKILTATGTQTFNPTCPAADAVVCVYSLVPVPDPTFTQAAYRMYADGTESGSTALAAQDTAPEVDVSGGDVHVQVRVRLQSTNVGAVASTDDYQLQWDKNASGVWTNVQDTTVVFDGYSDTNRNSQLIFADNTVLTAGQSFLGNGGALTRAGFYLAKTGSPTATITASLYEHAGTFGTSSTSTGTVLATSTTSLDPSTVSASPTYAWFYFDFDGTYTMTAAMPYVIALDSALNTIANYVRAGADNTSPTHAGNSTYRDSGWNSFTSDLIFTVSGTTPLAPYSSASLTDGAATTNRLGAGTGTFVAGEVSEDGLVDDYAPTVNNYTELLYSITLDSAGLTDGDTLTFRVLRNGATTGLTYTATPTIDIGGGVPTTTGTAQITASVATTTTGTRTVRGTALVTQAAATTVTGKRTVSGTALFTISGSANATVAGIVTVTGEATISSAVTTTATGTPSVPGTAALTESVAVTVAGLRTVRATAAVSTTAAVTATGTPSVPGTAALSAAPAITVTGLRTVRGTAALTAAAAATAVGKRTVRGTVALTEAATITVVGAGVAEVVPGTAALMAAATVTTVGTRVVRGTAALSASAVVAVAGTVIAEVVAGTALISSTVATTAVGKRTVRGTAALTQSVAVTVVGAGIAEVVPGTAVVSSAITTTAVGTPSVPGTAAISTAVTVAVVGRRVVRGTSAITAAATVTATAVRTVRATVAVTESATISVVGIPTGAGVGVVTITGSAAITATGRRTVHAAAALGVAPAVTVAGKRVVRASVALAAAPAVTVTGLRTVRGTVLRAEAVAVTVTGQRYKPGVALVTMGASVTVVGKRTRPGTATITATNAVMAVGKRTVRGVAVLTGSGTVTVGTATRTVHGQVAVGFSVVITGLVITYYDDAHPHTGSWTLTYMATYALEYAGTVDRRYRATYDADVPSGTWDLDHTGTWELV